jgi:dTDP-4-dehydrorhamnose 3,5-epimerase-like enzyme
MIGAIFLKATMKNGKLYRKKYNFVQDNESKSSYGVIRGLHYQLTPYTRQNSSEGIEREGI